MVFKRTFSAYQCNGKKRGKSTTRSGGKVNSTTIHRIRPRGAEWILRASADLCYLSYVPPMQECGTRPFLRWVWSQGRSPHAKIPSAPLAFPLLGAPQAPGNNPPPPEEGKNLGVWPPEVGGTLQCWGIPGRTAQRYDSLLNGTQQLERKGHKCPKRASVDLWILHCRSFVYILRERIPLCHTTKIESSSIKNGRRK